MIWQRPLCAMRRLTVLLFAVGLLGCKEKSKDPEGLVVPSERPDSVGREALKPLPEPPSVDSNLVALGRRLFHDKQLSSDKTVACSSCHDLAAGGDDGRKHSVGVRGRQGPINAPTVFNAGLNFVQFWDGRAKTLEEQVDGPVSNPSEMDASWDEILSKVRRDQQYVDAFARRFGDGVTANNVRAAIAAFERTLLTRGAPFDRWLLGDDAALTAVQKSGYELFKAVGCVACHQGRNVGGNMFQRFGVLGDYFVDRGDVTVTDYGRFNVTKNEPDRFVFRVPSLRNVAKTAPYFHDGSAETLPRAVQVMAKYQLGQTMNDDEVSQVVAFLEALSGPVPESALGVR